MASYTKYFDTLNSITLTDAHLDSIPNSGPCDLSIAELLTKPEISKQLNAIDKKELVNELHEYGCWEAEELEDHSENLNRLLWIVVGDLKEERYELDNE